MGTFKFGMLVCGLLAITLMLALPQVDLPDTAFNEGNTPILIKFHLLAQPLVLAATSAYLWFFGLLCMLGLDRAELAHANTAQPLLRRLCTFLC